MISKTLFFVLLGYSLALAHEDNNIENINTSNEVVVRSSVSENFSEWYDKAKASIKEAYDKTIEGFDKIYEKLVEVGKNVSEYSKEKLDELVAKYHEITNNAKVKLNELEKAALFKVIATLEDIVKALSARLASKTAEEIKEIAQKIYDEGKDVMDKVGGEIQEVAGKQVEQAKESLVAWKEKAEGFIGENNINEVKDVKDKVVEKVDDVKEKVVEKVDDVKEKVVEKVDDVKEKVVEKIDNVKETVGDLGSKIPGIGGKFGGLFGKN